jgi:zinc transporter
VTTTAPPSAAAETDHTGAAVDPLLFGFGFDAEGAATKLKWSDVTKHKLGGYTRVWLHLNRTSAQAQGWLQRRSDLERVVVRALLQDETRPRATRIGKGFLIDLRGCNLNPGDALDELVSVRMWATPTLLITLRARPLQATLDTRQQVEAGEAPNSTGGLVAVIAQALTNRMEPEIIEFDEQVDAFEEKLLDPKVRLPRSALATFRRRVLTVRRYILPQRDALAQLVRESTLSGLFSETDILHLRESADRISRLAEDLDTIRDRSTVLQEQILEERAEEMNKRLFLLSFLSAIFLPISFVVGLFGVNIGGMPGMGHPYAFTILSVFLMVIVVVMIAVFRWRRWI